MFSDGEGEKPELFQEEVTPETAALGGINPLAVTGISIFNRGLYDGYVGVAAEDGGIEILEPDAPKPERGYVAYDAASATLTLNNITLKGKGVGIAIHTGLDQFSSLKIELIGANSITAEATGTPNAAIGGISLRSIPCTMTGGGSLDIKAEEGSSVVDTKSLSITNATLNVTGKDYVLRTDNDNDLTIQDAEVNVKALGPGSNISVGIACYGSVSIGGTSKVRAEGEIAIRGSNSISISDGEVTAVSTGSNGSGLTSKEINISGGKVNTSADGYGIEANDILTINGNAEVIASSSGASSIRGKKNVVIEGKVSILQNSFEGISSAEDIVIKEGANVTINSKHTALYAKSRVDVLGGEVTAVSSEGTAIYSKNGSVAITGGIVETTGKYTGIQGDTGIEISGGNVTAISGEGTAIYSPQTTTITGGSVNATGYYRGIEGWDGVTISDGNVTAVSTNDSAIWSPGGSVVITDGIVQTTGYYEGISGENGVTISGGEVISLSSYSNSIYSPKNVTIEGGTIHTTGYYCGIQGRAGVTISDGNVTVVSTDDAGIWTPNVITITGGTVNATGYYRGVQGNAGIEISGGEVTAVSTNDAAIWSPNGTTVITGGTVAAASEMSDKYWSIAGAATIEGDAVVYVLIIPETTVLNKGVVYTGTTVSLEDGERVLSGGKGTVYGNPDTTGFTQPENTNLGANFDTDIKVSIPAVSYTGSAPELSPVVTVDRTALKETLVKDLDYTITIEGSDYSAGSKNAVITAVEGRGHKGSITVPFNITAKDVTASEQDSSQTVRLGVGKFQQPSLEGVNGEKVTGTYSYTYEGKSCTYTEVVEALAQLPLDSQAEVEFTLTANGNYTGTITGKVAFTVSAKDTPTGVPKYTAITTSGKTLADAALTVEGSTFNVEGTVVWNQPETTKVQANVSYTWTFTPKDTDNYNILTGSIVLWHYTSIDTYYTLSFDSNGGSNISSVSRISGSVVSLSGYTPIREGCEFAGWYADASFTIPVTEVTLIGNKTVYAKWTVPGLPDGTEALPDGSFETPDGVIIKPDGTVVLPDGTVITSDEEGKKPIVDKEGNVTAPDGTVYKPDGTVHNTDGSIQDGSGEYLRPAKGVIDRVIINGNRVDTHLAGDAAGASGYDYVIGTSADMLQTKEYLVVNKNQADTDTSMYYVGKGTYYAACHAWVRGEDGKKVFGLWSELKAFEVTATTPDTPKITKVRVSGRNVTVTYTRSKNATGYDIVLGSTAKKVNGELRPVDYGKFVKKITNGNTVTVTFRNCPKDTYYVGLHAYNRTSEDKKKVFSPWSNTKKVIVK